ncbi:MAG: hypothetical protein KAS32_20195 [Candidatus Peribacteraceae bacterium]|nr:hypothetical protein [Candidatus Peribacteraceae bacterium]
MNEILLGMAIGASIATVIVGFFAHLAIKERDAKISRLKAVRSESYLHMRG